MECEQRLVETLFDEVEAAHRGVSGAGRVAVDGGGLQRGSDDILVVRQSR